MSDFKPGDRLVYMGDGKWQKDLHTDSSEETQLAWRDLTVAAADLGTAIAKFEQAMEAYKATKPYGARCISMSGNHEQCILDYRHKGRHQFDETHRDVKPSVEEVMGLAVKAQAAGGRIDLGTKGVR